MKIIFAGTPEFSLPPLQALIDTHEVVAVFTQPDRRSGRGKKLSPPPVKCLAIEHDIPVFQPHSLKDQVSLIKSLDADVMVVVAYGMLLPQSVLDLPLFGCINIHASLLPRWRGAAPIQRAIEAGDSETGVSIMQMEAGLDTGPVFQKLVIAINHDDTSKTLHEKLATLGAKGIIDTLEQLDKHAKPTPQSDEGANYAKKISKQEAEIDWSLDAQTIDAKVRAFNPWPICQTQHNLTRIRIWRASAHEQASSEAPGTILDISDLGIEVACGSGVLRLEVLQKDGSRELTSKQFCNGYELAIGDVLAN